MIERKTLASEEASYNKARYSNDAAARKSDISQDVDRTT